MVQNVWNSLQAPNLTDEALLQDKANTGMLNSISTLLNTAQIADTLKKRNEGINLLDQLSKVKQESDFNQIVGNTDLTQVNPKVFSAILGQREKFKDLELNKTQDRLALGLASLPSTEQLTAATQLINSGVDIPSNIIKNLTSQAQKDNATAKSNESARKLAAATGIPFVEGLNKSDRKNLTKFLTNQQLANINQSINDPFNTQDQTSNFYNSNNVNKINNTDPNFSIEMNSLFDQESVVGKNNGYGAYNEKSDAVGKLQLTPRRAWDFQEQGILPKGSVVKTGKNTYAWTDEGRYTYQNDKDIQDISIKAQDNYFKNTIEKEGWDKLEGTVVQGVPITRSGLYRAMNLGGVKGVRNFLQKGENPSDGATKISDAFIKGNEYLNNVNTPTTNSTSLDVVQSLLGTKQTLIANANGQINQIRNSNVPVEQQTKLIEKVIKNTEKAVDNSAVNFLKNSTVTSEDRVKLLAQIYPNNILKQEQINKKFDKTTSLTKDTDKIISNLPLPEDINERNKTFEKQKTYNTELLKYNTPAFLENALGKDASIPLDGSQNLAQVQKEVKATNLIGDDISDISVAITDISNRLNRDGVQNVSNREIGNALIAAYKTPNIVNYITDYVPLTGNNPEIFTNIAYAMVKTLKSSGGKKRNIDNTVEVKDINSKINYLQTNNDNLIKKIKKATYEGKDYNQYKLQYDNNLNELNKLTDKINKITGTSIIGDVKKEFVNESKKGYNTNITKLLDKTQKQNNLLTLSD